MQPYFLPYIGYFQLINAVDEFVIYDNIQYTKKGWVNRNRFLQRGSGATFSIPVKNASHLLDIRQREISESFQRDKLATQLTNAYAKAPHFDCFPIIQNILQCEEKNLFAYILNSISQICSYLNIGTQVTVSSSVGIDHRNLSGKARVLAICRNLNASTYINPIGGIGLYQKADFREHAIHLCFLKAGDIKYRQFNNDFVPNLSIVDLMMFNSKEKTVEYLDRYTLV